MDGAPLYREDMRDGVPATPLRSLTWIFSHLAAAARNDLATGQGLCDTVLLQSPPRELAGSVAAVAAFAEALAAQMAVADRYFAAAASGSCAGLDKPNVRDVVMHLAMAVLHLADVLRQWVAEAEVQADTLEAAVMALAQRRAIATDADDVLTVLPIGADGNAP